MQRSKSLFLGRLCNVSHKVVSACSREPLSSIIHYEGISLSNHTYKLVARTYVLYSSLGL